jgi:glycosyltransferase involved in cell wall biosynthesis
MKLSLCMVVHNEAKALPKIFSKLSSVVDEIVIMDQGSTDNTQSVCEKSGAYYHRTTKKGLADIDRQECYNLANGDVVLALDADEMPDSKMINWIKDVKAKGLDYDVVWFRFKNLVDGVDIKSLLGDDWHPRLWKRSDQKMPVIVWPQKAHTFPSINTSNQLFCLSGMVDHVRTMEKCRRVFRERGQVIDPNNVQIETQFMAQLEQLIASQKRKR